MIGTKDSCRERGENEGRARLLQPRRLFLGAGLGIFGCAHADGRGAGAPFSPAELAQKEASPAPSARPTEAPPSPEDSDAIARQLSLLERDLGGRLGVFAFSHAGSSGQPRELLSHRPDERFALCSTFKWALAAACLLEVEAGRWALSDRLTFGDADVQEYAPVARERREIGYFTLEQACAAAVSFSDNTATNLLLQRIGGPSAVTAFFRSLGDSVTRLDRGEPELNSNLPGDVRDTTSPRAMARAFAATLASDVLGAASQALLTRSLVESPTGQRRLRAKFPKTITVAGKTGTGQRGACSDVVALWPPEKPPIFIAAYLSGSSAPLERLEAALAGVGERVLLSMA